MRTTCTRYVGTIHDFVMLNALADTPAARGAIGQANAALRIRIGLRRRTGESHRGISKRLARVRCRKEPLLECL